MYTTGRSILAFLTVSVADGCHDPLNVLFCSRYPEARCYIVGSRSVQTKPAATYESPKILKPSHYVWLVQDSGLKKSRPKPIVGYRDSYESLYSASESIGMKEAAPCTTWQRSTRRRLRPPPYYVLVEWKRKISPGCGFLLRTSRGQENNVFRSNIFAPRISK